MSYELRPSRLGAAAMINGSMSNRLQAQGSLAPLMSSRALDAMRDRLAPMIEAGSSTASAPIDFQERCACMLNAIPGIAESEENMQAGMALCVQDPTAFEQQVASAGWTTHCGTELVAAGATPLTRAGAFLASTEGKVAIGVGAAVVLGLGAWFVLR